MSTTTPLTSTTTTTTTQQTTKAKALTAIANLIKLLPTGTVFIFEFLNPLLTNNGQCHLINKYLSAILISISAFSCCFASFTDSYTDSDGTTHYAVVTEKGLWPSTDSGSVDLSKYRLRFGDFVHAFFALVVFLLVAMLDSDTVGCWYPSFGSAEVLLMVLPPVIGAFSSSVFLMFPSTRHGIGYSISLSSSS